MRTAERGWPFHAEQWINRPGPAHPGQVHRLRSGDEREISIDSPSSEPARGSALEFRCGAATIGLVLCVVVFERQNA
jgi:hypothetical protein